MPKIPTKLDWVRTNSILKQPVHTIRTLRLLIPATLVKRLGWEGEDSVNIAKIYDDVLLVWKETNEPEVSILARAKILPPFGPIKEQKMEEIVRAVVSRYVLGAGIVEIIHEETVSIEFISELERTLNEKLGLRAPFPPPGERIVIPITPPLNSFYCLKEIYDETLAAVNETIQILVKGAIDSTTFDTTYKKVAFYERNCDYWKRTILRDVEVNKIDRIDDLPYIATIPKYLEPISDHTLDMMEHVKRLTFEIPDVVRDYARVFKEDILDKGYFIDPYPTEDYETSFLHDVISECIRLESEEARKVMEKLEKSKNLNVKSLVNSCFLVSRISGICRNLHNIAEIKYDWQNSHRIQNSKM